MEGEMGRAAVVAATLLAWLAMSWSGDRPQGSPHATRSVVYATHGMVAAAHPVAVQIGVDILRRGGSAVDAAIAVNAALALMEPVSCGLGGDLFAMVWDPARGELTGLNGSGRAPRGLTRELVPAEPDGTIPLYSPYSWTVPGCVDGWFELHARYGRLPMAEVLAPTIAAAREGVPVPQVIAGAWTSGERAFREKPGFAEVFLPGGRAPREGELFANPALARTLELLAGGGRDAFYQGPIAERLLEYSARHGGFFSAEDLAGHRSDWVAPVSASYRGVTVYELPPNGQGLAALQMLRILEGYDLAALGPAEPDFWHLLIESKKLAYADRAAFYADPEFAKAPVDGLLRADYARGRAALIDMKRAAREVVPGDPRLIEGDTTYLATADASGMMVSLIQSNYTGFGSGYVVPEIGFGIQDRGGLFSLDPAHPNALEPGKRPFHTIIPAFLAERGVPNLAFGVMGGDMQPQGHVQIVVNLVDLGMNLQEAGDAPRFRHTGSQEPTGTRMVDGGVVLLESGVPFEVRRELLRRGHRLQEASGAAFGGYQAIRRDPGSGVYSGASESRKDGAAAGF
jgi:gamma-glutamyltranspeptidase/glutathione hydrolase